MCSHLVQLYHMYPLYYLVLSVFCASYLDYFAALTQILRALAAPTQLVLATASCRPSRANVGALIPSARPQPSIRLHCPYPIGSTRPIKSVKPTPPIHFIQHAKCCVPYLPLKAISEPIRQVKPYETVPPFLNRLPASPSRF